MLEDLSKTIITVVEALTNDVLTFVVVTPAVTMAFMQIALPDWYILAVGMVITYYFKKE